MIDKSYFIPRPGLILKKKLERADMSAYRLSKITRLPESAISNIVNGKRRITIKTALALSIAFEYEAEFWLTSQFLYDLNELDRVVSKD